MTDNNEIMQKYAPNGISQRKVGALWEKATPKVLQNRGTPKFLKLRFPELAELLMDMADGSPIPRDQHSLMVLGRCLENHKRGYAGQPPVTEEEIRATDGAVTYAELMHIAHCYAYGKEDMDAYINVSLGSSRKAFKNAKSIADMDAWYMQADKQPENVAITIAKEWHTLPPEVLEWYFNGFLLMHPNCDWREDPPSTVPPTNYSGGQSLAPQTFPSTPTVSSTEENYGQVFFTDDDSDLPF